LLFFRGDGNGEGGHDNLARKIAMAGREWSRTFWRKEDLIAYLFRFVQYFWFFGEKIVDFSYTSRLTLEYARLMNTDRESMTFLEGKDW
jgi:hypothetical protein